MPHDHQLSLINLQNPKQTIWSTGERGYASGIKREHVDAWGGLAGLTSFQKKRIWDQSVTEELGLRVKRWGLSPGSLRVLMWY